VVGTNGLHLGQRTDTKMNKINFTHALLTLGLFATTAGLTACDDLGNSERSVFAGDLETDSGSDVDPDSDTDSGPDDSPENPTSPVSNIDKNVCGQAPGTGPNDDESSDEELEKYDPCVPPLAPEPVSPFTSVDVSGFEDENGLGLIRFTTTSGHVGALMIDRSGVFPRIEMTHDDELLMAIEFDVVALRDQHASLDSSPSDDDAYTYILGKESVLRDAADTGTFALFDAAIEQAMTQSPSLEKFATPMPSGQENLGCEEWCELFGVAAGAGAGAAVGSTGWGLVVTALSRAVVAGYAANACIDTMC